MARERDANGRWKKGVSGNPKGRPKETTVQDLDLLKEMLTPEVRRRIYAVAISRAEAGDRHARAFLWAYRFGKPIERQIIESSGDVVLEWVKREDNGTASA